MDSKHNDNYIWIPNTTTTTYGFQTQPQRQLHMEFKDNYNDIWNLKTFTTTYGIRIWTHFYVHMDMDIKDIHTYKWINYTLNIFTGTYGNRR
jgi:hypothetical protein